MSFADSSSDQEQDNFDTRAAETPILSNMPRDPISKVKAIERHYIGKELIWLTSQHRYSLLKADSLHEWPRGTDFPKSNSHETFFRAGSVQALTKNFENEIFQRTNCKDEFKVKPDVSSPIESLRNKGNSTTTESPIQAAVAEEQVLSQQNYSAPIHVI